MSKLKPKIAVIGLKGLPAFGGAARTNEYIINRLKNKYSYTIYAIDSHTNEKGLYNGYNQIVFKSISNSQLNTFIYYWKSLFHCLLKRNYDLILLNHAEAGFITPFLKIKYNVITIVHGVFNKEDEKFNKIVNIFFKFSEILNYKFSDFIVSVSKPDLEYIKSKTNKKVVHIPNGVNLNEPVSPQKIRYSDYLLFAAGRIYGIKGLHIFLCALKTIKYKGKVLIIGDLNQVPDYKSKTLELSAELNVTHIELLKDRTLLMKYIEAAKLFVFPSLFEAMSNMLLEVASMKTPIVCSNIPGNKAIFNSNEVLFFESKDINDLAGKISWALQNFNQMKTRADNAYQRLGKNHDWSKLARLYQEVYSKLLTNY